MKKSEKPSDLGVVLTGGGARGAYQAGALHAIAQIAQQSGVENPFPIISGTSAGAINATALAARNHPSVLDTCAELRKLWENLTTGEIYRTDLWSIARIGARWVTELSTGGLVKKKTAGAMLDTAPLRRFLEGKIVFERIGENLKFGALRSLAISAVNYSTGTSRVFYQTLDNVEPWRRSRRSSERATIRSDHVLASAAIPVLFPPVRIDGRYFGDGSLRNYAPMSPVIHLGASRVFVVAVRQEEPKSIESDTQFPSVARIFGVILNAVLLDAIDSDLERLFRINQTVRAHEANSRTLRPVEVCMIRPSEDLGKLALSHISRLPKVLRHLISGLGAAEEASDLVSYLLFEPPFLKQLADLGFQDTMRDRTKIENFLASV